jgi:phytoene dehydrogenase-like protein
MNSSQYNTRRSILKAGAAGLVYSAIGILSGACWSSRTRRPLLPTARINTPNIIIIGSGITGLCAGAILSKLGYQILVLEAHPELLGGHARSFVIDGLKFCAGPQYVWNFIPEKNVVGTRILKYLGLDKDCPFEAMDSTGFERFYIGEDSGIDIPAGWDGFRNAITSRFPEERQALLHFFNYIDILFKGSKVIHDAGRYMDGRSDMIRTIALSSKLTLKEKIVIKRLHNKTLQDVFDMCAIPDKPRRALYGHAGIFAENAESLSAGLYASATGYYHSGPTFPIKGFDALIDGLVQSIQNDGGRVLKDKRVRSLSIHNQRIAKVICDDRTEYESGFVISNLSPRLTARLVEGHKSDRYSYDVSNSLISCFIGVRDYPAIEKLARKNFWWQAYPEKIDFNHTDMTQEPRFLYINSATASQIEGSTNSPFKHSLTVFCPGDFSQAKAAYEAGPEKHDELKVIIAKNIISVLEKRFFPNLHNHVEFVRVLSPWDLQIEIGAERGSVYGRKPDVRNVLRKINQIPGINNLRIACATMGQPGIATGFQTAHFIVKELTGLKV